MATTMKISQEGDQSNGWEALAERSIEQRDRSRIGVETIEAWCRWLPEGAAVLDLGCGPGGPRSQVLFDRGLEVHAVEAAPSLAAAYRQRFPAARVACEAAESSDLFGRKFKGAMAWGLIFLLPAEAQKKIIENVARALEPTGHFLFTAPAESCSWADLWTGRPSVSLGERNYKKILAKAGLTLFAQYVDEGDNNYYASIKS